jgi:hypothetical protein
VLQDGLNTRKEDVMNERYFRFRFVDTLGQRGHWSTKGNKPGDWERAYFMDQMDPREVARERARIQRYKNT